MTQRGEQSGDSGKAVNREDFIQISLVTEVLLLVFFWGVNITELGP